VTKRKLTIILAIPLLAALILFMALYGALHTTTGAHLILSSLQGQLAGRLEIAEFEGDLSTGLQLRNIGYRDSAMSVHAERIQLTVSLDILPFVVRVKTLNIRSLEVQALQDHSGNTPPGVNSPGDVLSSLALPVPLAMDELLVKGFAYFDVEGTPVITAELLSAAARLHETLEVITLVLEMENGRYQLEGSLALAEPFPIEARLNSKFSLGFQEDSAQTDFDIQARLMGNLSNQLNIALSSKAPAVTVSGTLREILNTPEWQLELESPGLWWPLESPQNAVGSIESLSMRSEGQLESYSLFATGFLHIPDLDKVELDLQANGSSAGLEISALDLSGQELDLSATGELSWQDELKIKLVSTLDRIEPGDWIAKWPDNKPVKGGLELSLQGQIIQFSELHLEAADSSMTLDCSGEVDLEQETLTAEVAWKGLGWPVGSELPDIQSRNGQIRLSGTFDDWNVSGEAEVESTGLPPGILRFEASGNRDGARMTIVDGRILGGTINGEAEYNWSENGSWKASLTAWNIETAGLHHALPGRVNADLTAMGKLEPFQLDLDIQKLEGEIRNEQISAAGRVQIQQESLEFSNVLVRSASSTVTLHGSTNSAAGVEFSANIADLGSFLAHSSGSIQADGRVSLKVGKPRLRLSLEGQDVVWEDLRLPQISIHNSGSPNADTITGLNLEAINLQYGGQLVDKIKLDIDITNSAQAIRLAARKSGLELSANLNGSLQENGLPLSDSVWVGQLRSFAISKDGQTALHLLQPAGIDLSVNKAAIRSACLGAGANSSMCLNAGWRRGSLFSASVKLEQVPLKLIQSLLDSDLELTQYAEGEIHWELAADSGPSGHARIRLSPGEVRFADDTEVLFKTGEGLIGFKLDEGSLSAGNFDLPLPGLGGVDLDFSIENIASGLASEMDGRLRLDLADLDIVTVFLPMVDRADGRLEADLTLSGSAARPYFSGYISLADGLVAHDASGLRLSEIQLSGQVTGNERARLNGSFRALDGTGRLQAIVDLSDILSPRVELSLVGENLTLLDAPDLKVVAEPDIQLEWQDGVLDINGSLLIPSARIAPSVLPESTVLTSPDLVIVAGELPGSEAEAETKSDIAIRGNFEVTLGEEVELDLFVAVAKVNGSVNFTWQDELLPIANGNYSLAGQIQAFGQVLRITEGNIGFPGVPADNPHLNIRAERQIYGNSEIRRAGVFVTGTLSRPIVEPYTDPMTNRERAQTLLITGSDFNMETGVGAVDIGTYIAPRVFVSYGICVFEDENVISIRYDLGRNWGIKATSGQRQTGLDISYTIER